MRNREDRIGIVTRRELKRRKGKGRPEGEERERGVGTCQTAALLRASTWVGAGPPLPHPSLPFTGGG